MKSTNSLRVSIKWSVSVITKGQNKILRAESEILWSACIEYQIDLSFRCSFVHFAVPWFDTEMKKSVPIFPHLITPLSAARIARGKLRQRVTLLARVTLQGNIAECCPARDVLSTNQNSKSAAEY